MLREGSFVLPVQAYPHDFCCTQTYVDGKMSAEELEGYDCAAPRGHTVPEFWGNFTGPCCKPKSQRAANG